jgi:hypothetical protein
MSYTGNLTYADERNFGVEHPDYVPLADRRRPAFRPDPAVITFARLDDGEWGIKGVVLVGGDVVTVTKKDGTTVERVVGEVVKTRDGYDYATIVQVPREVTVEVGVPTAQVPDGRYAVHNDDQSVNDIAFYEVENVTEGKWQGWTFVRQIVGGDEQKLSQKQGRTILAKIVALGVVESFQLYGRSTEVCGVCNTNLTNKESREYGIGPKCRKKFGC